MQNGNRLIPTQAAAAAIVADAATANTFGLAGQSMINWSKLGPNWKLFLLRHKTKRPKRKDSKKQIH